MERCLVQAALWDERSRTSSTTRHVARAASNSDCASPGPVLAPDILLMDEPCSALDPVATLQVEQLMTELRAS